LVAEAATVSEAIQAGEKAELEGRNAVRIITPSGQSFSVSEYKVVGNVVDVMRVEVTRLTRNRFPGRYKAS
jgi:hypothetical protein